MGEGAALTVAGPTKGNPPVNTAPRHVLWLVLPCRPGP